MQIKKLSALDTSRPPISLAGQATDVLLLPGDTAVLEYSAAVSVPLRIKAEEGLYELEIIGDATVTIGTLAEVWLQPNNTTVAAGVIDRGVVYNKVPTDANFDELGGNGKGLDHTAFELGRNIICFGKYLVSTKTKSKVVSGHYLRKDSASVLYQNLLFTIWNETATAWTSLGTVVFPFAQTGTIIIRRVI